MMKQIIFGLSLALASGAALAQEEWDFDEWDADDDGAITESEFGEGFGDDTDVFDTWDVDDDDVLSEDEFSAGLFNFWDENDDDLIDEDEWNEVEEEGLFDV